MKPDKDFKKLTKKELFVYANLLKGVIKRMNVARAVVDADNRILKKQIDLLQLKLNFKKHTKEARSYTHIDRRRNCRR